MCYNFLNVSVLCDGLNRVLFAKNQLVYIGFWLRRGCLRFFVLTRALVLGNGRSLRTKILRTLLAKFPIFQLV